MCPTALWSCSNHVLTCMCPAVGSWSTLATTARPGSRRCRSATTCSLQDSLVWAPSRWRPPPRSLGRRAAAKVPPGRLPTCCWEVHFQLACNPYLPIDAISLVVEFYCVFPTDARVLVRLTLSSYYSLRTTYCVLLTTYYVLLTTYYLLPTTYYLLPTPYYLLLTTQYSLFTTHYLLLTTYY